MIDYLKKEIFPQGYMMWGNDLKNEDEKKIFECSNNKNNNDKTYNNFIVLSPYTFWLNDFEISKKEVIEFIYNIDNLPMREFIIKDICNYFDEKTEFSKLPAQNLFNIFCEYKLNNTVFGEKLVDFFLLLGIDAHYETFEDKNKNGKKYNLIFLFNKKMISYNKNLKIDIDFLDEKELESAKTLELIEDQKKRNNLILDFRKSYLKNKVK